jgi:uncharacterized membrane protein
MTTTKHPQNKTGIENILGILLIVGVSVAAGIILCGGVLYLTRNGNSKVDFSVFKGVQPDLRRVRGIIKEMVSLKSGGFIELGVLALILTPFARVLLSFVAFSVKKEPLYMIITATVLALLIVGLAA